MNEQKQKMEYSKKLLWVHVALVGLLTVATIVATFMNYETSGITVVAGAAWAEFGAACACYYIKAKAENRLKIAKGIVQSLSKIRRFDPSVLVEIMNSIIRE